VKERKAEHPWQKMNEKKLYNHGLGKNFLEKHERKKRK
jgi:hypothetical protein